MLWILCFVPAMQSQADIYENSYVIPEITSIVFARDYVALTVEPAWHKGTIAAAESHQRFFLADRSDYRFDQITEREFAEQLKTDHLHRYMTMGTRNLENEQGLRVVEGACTNDSVTPTELDFEDLSVTVDLKCSSSVNDVLRLDDEIWITTYKLGSHGVFGGEGLLVISLDGDVKARKEIGEYVAAGLARDPWSTDVWALTLGRITVFSKAHTVKRLYWPIHDFDKDRERPDVFVIESMNGARTNPLAVIAYGLGEKNYQKFFRSVKELPNEYDESLLGNYFMGGRYHNPMLPEELNVLLDEAEPVHIWRNFVCLLNDERAKDLCGLDFTQWPVAKIGSVE